MTILMSGILGFYIEDTLFAICIFAGKQNGVHRSNNECTVQINQDTRSASCRTAAVHSSLTSQYRDGEESPAKLRRYRCAVPTNSKSPVLEQCESLSGGAVESSCASKPDTCFTPAGGSQAGLASRQADRCESTTTHQISTRSPDNCRSVKDGCARQVDGHSPTLFSTDELNTSATCNSTSTDSPPTSPVSSNIRDSSPISNNSPNSAGVEDCSQSQREYAQGTSGIGRVSAGSRVGNASHKFVNNRSIDTHDSYTSRQGSSDIIDKNTPEYGVVIPRSNTDDSGYKSNSPGLATSVTHPRDPSIVTRPLCLQLETNRLNMDYIRDRDRLTAEGNELVETRIRMDRFWRPDSFETQANRFSKYYRLANELMNKTT